MGKKVFIFIFFSLLLLALFTSCTKKPEDIIIGNQAPETYIVNIPPDSSYIHHARVLYWYGTDADGIVTRYDWAIDDTTYNENIAGSGWHSLYVDSTIATQDTIAFEAPLPDTIYRHIFYVRAVDNRDQPDQTPATRVFNTSNILPNTRFVSTPKDSSQRFILGTATDMWKGINFVWSAIDSDMVFPAQFQYLWGKPDSIPDKNDPRWSDPVSEESYYFTGENAPFEEGYHTVYVRAFDDAGGFDPSLSDTTIYISEIDSSVAPWDTTYDTLVYNQWKTIYFVKPEIHLNPAHRKVLFINFGTMGNTFFIKPFYYSILIDSLQIAIDSLNYTPVMLDSLNHLLFGSYSTIMWTKDDKTDWSDFPLGAKQDLITDFLHIGGRVIFAGSKVLNMGKAFAPNISFALNNLFPYNELHISQYENFAAGDTSISPFPSDTAFFNEKAEYPHLSLRNNTSLPNNIWWNLVKQWLLVDALQLDLWGEYDGELEVIYSINHYEDNAAYEGVPCATRFTYDGSTTPGFFYFGFPLSYCDYGQGTQLLRQVLINELGE